MRHGQVQMKHNNLKKLRAERADARYSQTQPLVFVSSEAADKSHMRNAECNLMIFIFLAGGPCRALAKEASRDYRELECARARFPR